MHKVFSTAYIKMWWRKGVIFMFKSIESIHFIGIGGISMSGIAKLLLRQRYRISGSDLEDSHLLAELRERGARIYIGHSAANVGNPDLVVVSSAIPENNPELDYAVFKGIPVIKRAEMIAMIMEDKKGIAISGTHGKTTTTSIVATMLKEGGFDPTVLVGGELGTINGNAFLGDGDFMVTEADESDGSFLYYKPQVVVVTNIEMDHQDYYDSKNKLLNTFEDFMKNIPEDGELIACADDDNVYRIINEDDQQALTYGIKRGVLRAVSLQLLPFGSIFKLMFNDCIMGEINLQVPGRHNILNALAATAVGLYAGMEFSSIKAGIEKYTGVRRRFEKKGLIDKVLVVDDYAHHPTEIEATLKAAKNTGYERVIAVFQPHRYTRTKHLMKEFSESFELVDHLIVTDIYSAGEKEIPGVDARELAKLAAQNLDLKVEFIASLEDIAVYLEKVIRPKDLVLTIGAGDVYRVGEMFIDRMKKQREMA